jgi:8-oxo-dGTP pyrophosphatase MutT (NUDIX family)
MKIFVNNVLFNLIKPGESLPQSMLLPIKDVSEIIQLYEQVTNAHIHKNIQYNFIPDNYYEIKERIKAHFQIIYAAGGLVTKGNQILFIKRSGKWDLPKGKVDKGEDKKAAALREVWEECGIKAKLIQKIESVWHTYTQNKINTLKKTTWYEMECLDDSQMKPQTEEDITKVKWVGADERAKILANSYASITYVVDKWAKQPAAKNKMSDN